MEIKSEEESIPLAMVESLLGTLTLLSAAAQAADGSVGSIARAGDLVEKCVEFSGHFPLLVPIYDAILCAAAFNRDQAKRIEQSSETLAFVYFMRRADGLIKIGYSYDPKKRRAQVEQQCRQSVVILATKQGAEKAEKALHARFAAQRVEGEWFTESPELLAEIALHQKPAPS